MSIDDNGYTTREDITVNVDSCILGLEDEYIFDQSS